MVLGQAYTVPSTAMFSPSTIQQQNFYHQQAQTAYDGQRQQALMAAATLQTAVQPPPIFNYTSDISSPRRDWVQSSGGGHFGNPYCLPTPMSCSPAWLPPPYAHAASMSTSDVVNSTPPEKRHMPSTADIGSHFDDAAHRANNRRQTPSDGEKQTDVASNNPRETAGAGKSAAVDVKPQTMFNQYYSQSPYNTSGSSEERRSSGIIASTPTSNSTDGETSSLVDWNLYNTIAAQQTAAAAVAAVNHQRPYVSGFPTTMQAPHSVHNDYVWMRSIQQQQHRNSLVTTNGLCPPSGPGTNNVRVRTREKYRMVYSDYQRLELEKEFHYNKYINTIRKTELSQNLSLTERQIKIWFQNRRAKERRQAHKEQHQMAGGATPMADTNSPSSDEKSGRESLDAAISIDSVGDLDDVSSSSVEQCRQLLVQQISPHSHPASSHHSAYRQLLPSHAQQPMMLPPPAPQSVLFQNQQQYAAQLPYAMASSLGMKA